MNKTSCKKVCSLLVCAVLIATMALFCGCGQKTESPTNTPSITFPFSVVDDQGNQTDFSVTTTKKTVGEALQDEHLIEGDEGQYGLYVKKVNGILAEYESTGTYWAFYVNGELAPKGVDQTPVVAGESYAFKVAKG